MDLVRSVLVAMHPRAWRQRYGEEFRALLEDTRLTPATVLDVLRNCIAVQARAHPSALVTVGAALVSVASEIVAARAGLTANIGWAPTNLSRALAMLGTVGPWAGLAGWMAVRRRAAKRA
jgi:hypothetical protein